MHCIVCIPCTELNLQDKEGTFALILKHIELLYLLILAPERRNIVQDWCGKCHLTFPTSPNRILDPRWEVLWHCFPHFDAPIEEWCLHLTIVLKWIPDCKSRFSKRKIRRRILHKIPDYFVGDAWKIQNNSIAFQIYCISNKLDT